MKSDVRDLIFKYLRIRKLCSRISKDLKTRIYLFVSFFVSKVYLFRELKNFKKL